MNFFRSCLFGVLIMTCFSISAGHCNRNDKVYFCNDSILDVAVCEGNPSNIEEMICALPDFNLSVTFSKPEDNEHRKKHINDQIFRLCALDHDNCNKHFSCGFVAPYCN